MRRLSLFSVSPFAKRFPARSCPARIAEAAIETLRQVRR
jgi:hypothetical protein